MKSLMAVIALAASVCAQDKTDVPSTTATVKVDEV